MAMKIKRLAYITSMATGGLAGFNFRELREMQKLNIEISLFITFFTDEMLKTGISNFSWYLASDILFFLFEII